jgi:transcriptional regulator GlxA family with amidase domain
MLDSSRVAPAVLQMRVEAAPRLLERTDRGLKPVGAAAGFGMWT